MTMATGQMEGAQDLDTTRDTEGATGIPGGDMRIHIPRPRGIGTDMTTEEGRGEDMDMLTGVKYRYFLTWAFNHGKKDGHIWIGVE
jgi:hypothetical protein